MKDSEYSETQRFVEEEWRRAHPPQWPKAVSDEDFVSMSSFDSEQHFAVVSADLARELYEALKVADGKIEGEWSYRLDRVEAALTRYEREVRDDG